MVTLKLDVLVEQIDQGNLDQPDVYGHAILDYGPHGRSGTSQPLHNVTQ